MAPSRRTVTWPAHARLIVLCCVWVIGCTASGLGLGAGMRVELTTDGGFAAIPVLAKPILVDAANLSPELSGVLERLVDSALAEKVPRGSGKRAPVPDGRHYRITIQRGDTRDEIEAADPMIPPAFAALMEFVRVNMRR
jgi:hypothetical protein